MLKKQGVRRKVCLTLVFILFLPLLVSNPVKGETSYQSSLGFSSVQGQNNWYYQEWNGSNYVNMIWNSTNSRWQGSYMNALINENWQHPDVTDSVRKWVAPKTGLVRITGNVAKGNIVGGDGVTVRIMKNSTKLWSTSIAYNDSRGYDVDLTTSVATGDSIYFIVNKNGDNSYDSTNWDPVITYYDSYVASAGFSSVQGQNNWYYQEWNGSNYVNMIWNSTNSRWQGSYMNALISENWQHPDVTDSVRKWVAPKTGLVRITGNVAKGNIVGGDGVTVRIMKNTTKLWSTSIAYNDSRGYDVDLTTSVATGDSIYFIVNKNGDNSYDSTNWDPVITYYDSYVASAGFSSVQGQNNWYYQEWNGSNYVNMIWNSTNSRWQGSYTNALISENWQHPDATDSVRKWVAPKTGLVRITGNVAKGNIVGGDGVTVRIMKNTTKLWSTSIAYNDSRGYDVDLTTSVATGDSIYFIVNKNGDISYDSTNWDPVITYYDSYVASAGFSSVQGQNNWYYQEWNGSNYVNMIWNSTNSRWQGSYMNALISENWQHPDATDSVRKWVAPKTGLVRITGNVAKGNIVGGDGVTVRIMKNSTKLWSASIAYNDSRGYDVDLTTSVAAGDSIYFIVNKNGDISYDSTNWDPMIGYCFPPYETNLYDALNILKQINLPSGQTINYQYDKNGNLVRRIIN